MDRPVISAQALTVTLGGIPALRAIDLSVLRGETLGVFGSEGSGKSILLRTLAGLCAPDGGTLSVLGDKPTEPAVRASVSYLPAHAALPADMSAAELIAFYSNAFSDFDSAWARAQLTALRLKMNKRFGELSLPTQKRVQLIFALSRSARLLLLDDPLYGDAATKAQALAWIAERKAEETTLLFTAREPADTEAILDRFLFLSHGEAVGVGVASGISVSEEFRRLSL